MTKTSSSYLQLGDIDMSIKNKAKDRDDNGRILRKYTGPESTFFIKQTPKHWRKLYMNQPRQHLNKVLCNKVVAGFDSEGIAFPLGNNKPHIYCW